MISVQNHLQRLNGSKLILLLICFSFFAACRTGKKTVRATTRPPITDPMPSTDVDTIAWSIDDNAPDPIKSDEMNYPGDKGSKGGDSSVIPNSEKLKAYNISVLFPFYSDAYNPENDMSRTKSMRAIQLYGGMRLAMEKLDKEGVSMNINVHDTKGRTDITRSLFQQGDIYNADVIFGPFRSDNLKIGAEIAQQNRRPFISPMNPSDRITRDNPYFVQVKPGLEAHCQAITNHVMEKYSPVQVILVVRDKPGEKQRLQLFQNALAQNKKSQPGERFREYLVSDYGNEFENMAFENYIIEGLPTVFVIPSWSSESFINNVLRKIRLVKGENEVFVYGMPQWKEFERISYDYFDALNVHISSDNRLDKSDTKIQNFAKAYFYKYGEAPTDDAYFGYDMTLYMGKMLIKHGSQFQTKLNTEPFMGLSTGFNFQSVYDLSDDDFETAPIKFIENKHVDILQFKDFYFQLAD